MRGRKFVSVLLGAAAFAALSFGVVSYARADGADTGAGQGHRSAPAARAETGDIHITLDQAFPIRLGAPATGVAIGNQNIAGVTVQDDHMLFVTGKAYGATNLVIVGDGGRVLYSGRVVVSPDEAGAVMVTRGTQVERLQCSPICRSHPDVGGAGATANSN